VASVFAIGLVFRGFSPGRSRCIFKGYRNLQNAFLGEEVNLSAPCRNILRHVKNTSEV
jgi:hypothetical protein